MSLSSTSSLLKVPGPTDRDKLNEDVTLSGCPEELFQKDVHIISTGSASALTVHVLFTSSKVLENAAEWAATLFPSTATAAMASSVAGTK
eukprot:jgi/Pico_ML_1/55960/g1565.t1